MCFSVFLCVSSVLCVSLLGQVVTWKLTPGLAFDNVEDTLVQLKQRLTAQGKNLKEFYIDNCCSWRNKLQHVFGNEVLVYLDIFHAVKRVAEKIPKRHPLRAECMQDLRMVFRDPADRGKERHMETPSPGVLQNNMDIFLQRWKNAEYDGKKVLKATALKQIANIQVHMKKGCLSGIKPGRGTNRNENLHKNLNSIMSASKYGVEYAYALLSLCFFRHNEKQLAKAEDRYAYPIEHYLLMTSQFRFSGSPEKFGLQFDTKVVQSSIDSQAIHLPVQLSLDSSYFDICDHINDTTLQSAFKVQEICVTDEELAQSQSQELEQLCCDEAPRPLITVSSVKAILLKALSWLFIHKSITSNSQTATLRVDTIPFMNSAMGNLFNPLVKSGDEDSHDAHVQRLHDVMKSWNFQRLAVPPDGNCLFYSVAENIRSKMDTGTNQEVLGRVGVDKWQSVAEMAEILRKLVVDEWLGENSNEYWGFIGTQEGLERQAKEFLESGEFASDIGDLVIAAISNALKTPIVVFTSVGNMPTLIQYPTNSQVSDPDPIYLAYLQHGPGHYDAAIPIPDFQEPSSSIQDQTPMNAQTLHHKVCYCGRKSVKGNPCAFEPRSYTCRCPCFKANQACDSSCRCKNCMNPYGQKKEQPTKPKTGQKRKRDLHDSQSVLLRGTKTKSFMEAVGEPISIGGFSNFEFLVVCAIIHSLMDEDSWNWDTSESIDVLAVHTMYTCVYEFVQALNLSLPLFQRNEEQLAKLLKLQLFRWEVFNQKCSMVRL